MASRWTVEPLAKDEAEWVRGEQSDMVLVVFANIHPHLDFRYRCCEKLGHLGDSAMDTQQHDAAFKFYSAALSIHPPSAQGSCILRSKVCMAERSWGDAIGHANEVSTPLLCHPHVSRQDPQAISSDPSSPWGYEIKHAALHGAGRYDDAVQAFEAMLSKMGESPDPQIRGKLFAPFHGNDDLLTSFGRASWSVRQSVQHTGEDSQNCSTNDTSFTTRTH